MSNVPSKSVQFFLVKLLLMLLVKSTVACKPVFNDPNKHQSKFICKSVSNVSNVKPSSFLVSLFLTSLVSSQILLSINLPVLFLILQIFHLLTFKYHIQ